MTHPLRLIAASAILLGACAQAAAPPGGDPDRYPPRIIGMTPDTNAVVPGYNGAVVFRFDETLSERGLREEDMVLVSPETGEVKVKRSGGELRVEIDGGWQKDRIYHVMVLPGVQDRFANARPLPFELVFSTGPVIPETAVAGMVTDRLTARAVANARVLISSTTDSTTYITLTDTAGFFAMRSLPLGSYRTTAFVDLNRNREIDFPEARDVKILSLLAQRDTPVVELSMLAPDTTPARLLRAEARDSATVRLGFDDFIPPHEQFSGAVISMWILPDSTPVASTGRLIHPRFYEAMLQAARDTTAAKPAAAGAPTATVSVVTDTVRLPTQEVVFVPSTRLIPQTRYRITISGITNMVNLPGGGGSVTFETPAPPRPAAPRDSTTVNRDTTTRRP